MVLRHVVTPRLQLDAVVADDLDAHVSLVSDPGSWAHLPSGAAHRPGDRLTPRAWGLGLAAELVTASLEAAHAVDPDRPVIAYLVEHNVRSRSRAERSGLSLVWRGPDAGNPDPAAVRLVYADRPLDDDVLAHVTALT